jgi:hypothetical protein
VPLLADSGAHEFIKAARTRVTGFERTRVRFAGGRLRPAEDKIAILSIAGRD